MRNGDTENGPRIADLKVGERGLRVLLTDGRALSIPLSFYPTLENAPPRDRRNWELIGQGIGVHWPTLDLDLSAEGFVRGEREFFPPPPKLRRRGRPSGREHVLRVAFRKSRGWEVSEGGRRLDSFPTKLEAQSEAISLGRLMGRSRVHICRKEDGKVVRIVQVGHEPQEAGQ